MKILFNLNGEQHLIEVGIGGSITADAEILWNEQIHGDMPEIELGKMEAYDELVDIIDIEENNITNEKKQVIKRKLRLLPEGIQSHINVLNIKTQIKINAESRAYLASTDWYIIRHAETGHAIPQEILNERELARKRVK